MSRNKGKRFKSDKKSVFSGKKIMILVIIVLILVTIVILKTKKTTNFLGFVVEKAGNMTILEEKVKEKKYKNMTLSNIELKRDANGYSYFSCIMKNDDSKKYKGEDVHFIFTGKNNTELAKFRYSLKETEPGKSIKIRITTSTDITDSEDFHIEEIQ